MKGLFCCERTISMGLIAQFITPDIAVMKMKVKSIAESAFLLLDVDTISYRVVFFFGG